MPSLREHCYNILNVPNGGKTPNNNGFSLPQVAYWVCYHSDSLKALDVNIKNYLDDSNLVDLGCLKLETVDAADCALFQWGTDVKKVVLPNTLQLRSNIINPIAYFGMIDKVTTIPFVDSTISTMAKYRMFPKYPDIQASLIGSTVYLRGKDALDLCEVNARGLFENPAMIKKCTVDTATTDCFDWDCNFQIGTHLLSTIYMPNGQPIAGLYERIWTMEMKLGTANLSEAPNNTTIKVE